MYDPSVPLLEHVERSLPELSRSERLVADLVISDPSAVVESTMARTARAAHVSEPTVMRFCTRLGFEGFQQFRLVLAQNLAMGLPATLSSITDEDTVPELSRKMFDHTITSLDRARRDLDHEAISGAVDAILSADALVFAGFGASGIVAADAEQKAALFGIPCSAPIDAHQQFMAATTADEGTVVVVISNLGRTTALVEVANAAREAGATVVAVTGDPASPVALTAQIVIEVRTFEDTDVLTPTASRLAALLVIDVLATAVSLRRGPEHAAQLARMKERLSRFRRSPG